MEKCWTLQIITHKKKVVKEKPIDEVMTSRPSVGRSDFLSTNRLDAKITLRRLLNSLFASAKEQVSKSSVPKSPTSSNADMILEKFRATGAHDVVQAQVQTLSVVVLLGLTKKVEG